MRKVCKRASPINHNVYRHTQWKAPRQHAFPPRGARFTNPGLHVQVLNKSMASVRKLGVLHPSSCKCCAPRGLHGPLTCIVIAVQNRGTNSCAFTRHAHCQLLATTLGSKHWGQSDTGVKTLGPLGRANTVGSKPPGLKRHRRSQRKHSEPSCVYAGEPLPAGACIMCACSHYRGLAPLQQNGKEQTKNSPRHTQ